MRGFYKLATKLFGEVLEPYGFTCEGSKDSTYHRRTDHDVYHIITPDQSRYGEKYSVMVFATAKELVLEFNERFPDGLGVPMGSDCRLCDKRGVGSYPDDFSCKDAASMRADFESRVAPALEKHAVPHLDKLQTLDDLVPLIHHKLTLAIALAVCGRHAESKNLLEQERQRLFRIDPDDGLVQEIEAHITSLGITQ